MIRDTNKVAIAHSHYHHSIQLSNYKDDLVKYRAVNYHRNFPDLTIVGGGLAGCEAAWQAACRGIKVLLYEMRPAVQTGAHRSPYLAELVCSNSMGSNITDRAAGVLKDELRALNSLLIQCAEQTAVPAGGALAVDRDLFAQTVTSRIENHPNIEVIRREIREIPGGTAIIATGPLTSPAMATSIQKITGREQIYFYDALAPIVIRDTINMDVAYQASRYEKDHGESGDYLNCPMSKAAYYHFVEALLAAETISLHEFESDINMGVKAGKHRYFEGCLPIEVIAGRGIDALAYGPLRPVGLTDLRTGEHSYAVVQLRQDNLARTLYNLVGFQTNLKYPEQMRVFRMIPGLERVEFARYGHMHRNTFIYSPGLLYPTLQCKHREGLFFAGQISGVEGYMGNVATGYVAGWNAVNFLEGKPLVELPKSTIIGSLCHYITHADEKDFQPMKANFGILPELEGHIRGKRLRAVAFAKRSRVAMQEFIDQTKLTDNTIQCA
jgi:methylenetetrahydrofolate--tRNA-(uracil-5-)-methyltransferase